MNKNNYSKYITKEKSYIIKKTITSLFKSLNNEHVNLLLHYTSNIISLIFLKTTTNKRERFYIFNSLMLKKCSGIKVIILTLLPFINEKISKDNIKDINDIYIEKKNNSNFREKEVKYKYSNLQYNRCIRNKILEEYKFNINDLRDNYLLLCRTIDICINKLYINWIDVIPISISQNWNEYKYEYINKYDINSSNNNLFYNNNVTKLFTQFEKYFLELENNNNWDINKDRYNNIDNNITCFNIFDLYETLINDLYYNVSKNSFLFYNISFVGFNINIKKTENANFNDDELPLILYLNKFLNLDLIIQNVSWYKLEDNNRNIYALDWYKIKNYKKDNTRFKFVYDIIYSRYEKYYSNINEVKHRIKNKENINEIEHIYEFLRESINSLKKTWYGKHLFININNKYRLINMNEYNTYLLMHYGNSLNNIYLYLQYLFIFLGKKRFSIEFDKEERIYLYNIFCNNKNINTKFKTKLNLILTGFVNNNYMSVEADTIYDSNNVELSNNLNKSFLFDNKKLIIDIFFETMVYKGTISQLKCTPETININKLYFGDKQTNLINRYFDENQMKYIYQNSYYYLTCDKYKYLKSKENTNYFDYIQKDGNQWFTQGAMEWVAQISFYHKYLNNRVILVTGATGVGKSTQIPKLLLYSSFTFDYKHNSSTVCTQPRITPTENNAKRISNELGIPIKIQNKFNNSYFTNNYNIQYKHGKGEHSNKNNNNLLTLQIVTDGLLYNKILNNPILKKVIKLKSDNKKYTIENEYDIIIIDESHEHNTNMDLILSLMKYTAYYNNDIKLVIVSATMDDDEPLFRRFYRDINDNRKYPFDNFIIENKLDRINVDRRVHIGFETTTKYQIDDIYKPGKKEKEIVLEIIQNYKIGDILIFEPKLSIINKLVKDLNNDSKIPDNVIAIEWHGNLPSEKLDIISNIHNRKNDLTLDKKRDSFSTYDIKNKKSNRYDRVIVVATNVAEASVTLPSLKFIIETGTQKIMKYNNIIGDVEEQIVSIDEKSRLQRKGRVGRSSSGQVYYLYKKGDKENKKSYPNITTENIFENIYQLLNTRNNENKLFSQKYNINNINNKIPNIKFLVQDEKIDIYDNVYTNTIKILNKKEFDKEWKYNIIDFLFKQYFIKKTPFSYNVEYDENTDILNSKCNSYYGNNEMYDYSNNRVPNDYYDTGYSIETVYDNKCNFFLIHPDENNLIRNIAGDIININNNNNLSINNINGINIINSIKMESMFEIMKKKMLFLYYDFNNYNEYYKTIYGIEIKKIRDKFKIRDNNNFITFIYGINYGNECCKKIIKILSMIGENNFTLNSLFKQNIKNKEYTTIFKQFYNRLGSDIGDFDFIIKLTDFIDKFINIDFLNNMKKENFKNNFKSDFLKEKYIYFNNKDNINNIEDKQILNIINKFNKYSNNNQLYNNNNLSEYEMDKLFRDDNNNTIRDYINRKINKIIKNNNLLEKWCIYNKINYNKVIEYLNNLSTWYTYFFKIKNDYFEIDYDNIDNNINSKNIFNIKKIINISDDINESVIKSFIHGYNKNIVRNISRKPEYYSEISNPDPEFFYEIPKIYLANIKETFMTNDHRSKYYFFFKKNDNNKTIMLINRVKIEWIHECLSLQFTPRNIKDNFNIIKNTKNKLNNLLNKIVNNYTAITNDNKELLTTRLSTDVLNKYKIELDKMNNELIYSNGLLIWDKIIRYFELIEDENYESSLPSMIITEIINEKKKISKEQLGGNYYLDKINNRIFIKKTFIQYLIDNKKIE